MNNNAEKQTKKATPKTRKPKIKWTYLLSGNEVTIDNVDVKNMLAKALPMLDQAELVSISFLKWEGTTWDDEGKFMTKVRVKVWKITSYCWAILIDIVILDKVGGKNLKVSTDFSGGIMATMCYCSEALGVKNLSALMPHWAEASDVLSQGPTKFEQIVDNDEEMIAIMAFSQYRVLAPGLTIDSLKEILGKRKFEDDFKELVQARIKEYEADMSLDVEADA